MFIRRIFFVKTNVVKSRYEEAKMLSAIGNMLAANLRGRRQTFHSTYEGRKKEAYLVGERLQKNDLINWCVGSLPVL